MKLFNTCLLLALGIFTSSLKAEDLSANQAELKAKIVEVASRYTGQVFLKEEARSKLEPLINELVASVDPRNEEEKLDQVIGGWKNLWSYRSFGFNTNYQQVYQIVSEEGYYYNLSELKLGRVSFAGFLRGAYKDVGEKLRIQFTSNKTKLGFYKEGTNLIDLVERFEAGEIRAWNVPGPIGVKGNLINLYVDDSLRIVTGNSDGGAVEDIFVLERTDTITKD